MNVPLFFKAFKKYLVLFFLVGCGAVNSGISVQENPLGGNSNNGGANNNNNGNASKEVITVQDVSFSGQSSQNINVDLSALVNGFSASKKYTYTIVTPPNIGIISIFNEKLTYTPMAEGQDSIQFMVASDGTNSNTGTISLTITKPVVDVSNDTLVLKDASISLLSNEVAIFDLKNLVLNINSSRLYNFVIVEMPKLGTLNMNMGSITYTPFTNVIGNDTILVRAGDGFATSNMAQINIKIEDITTAAPRWGQLTIDVPRGAPISVDLRTLLQAPHPFDGKAYNFTLLQSPKNGTATLNGNMLSFEAVQFGVDTSMRILVTDDLGQSTEGRFTLNITP